MDATAKQIIRPMPKAAVIQRQCVCGRSAGSDGTCAACALKRAALQRSASGTGVVANSGVAQAVGIAHRPGTPLDTGIRASMEQRLGRAARDIAIESISPDSQSAIDD